MIDKQGPLFGSVTPSGHMWENKKCAILENSTMRSVEKLPNNTVST